LRAAPLDHAQHIRHDLVAEEKARRQVPLAGLVGLKKLDLSSTKVVDVGST